MRVFPSVGTDSSGNCTRNRAGYAAEYAAGILLCVRYIRTGNYARILARENETQGAWNPNEAKIAAKRKNEEKMKALGLR